MNVLFVSNQASLTGAPLLLLWLVKWLRANTDYKISVVLMAEGPLQEDFAELCDTYTLPSKPMYQPLHKRILKAFNRNDGRNASSFLARHIHSFQPDILYLNTLVLGKYLGQALQQANYKIISHAHELDVTLNTLANPQDVSRQINSSTALICCAQCIGSNLRKNYTIDSSISMPTVYEYLPYSSEKELSKSLIIKEEHQDCMDKIRQAKHDDTFIFGSIGQPIARKGFDLFPLLVREALQCFKGQKFLAVWIGCSEHADLTQYIRNDLERMGLSEYVILVEPLRSILPILREFDVFTLLSREDPFPLVVLEAAALGIPALCFQNSGGMTEFISKECCVEYLDLASMAKELLRLSVNPNIRKELGEASRQKVFRNHTLASGTGEKILSIIQSVSSQRQQGIH